MGVYRYKNATQRPIDLSNLMGGECLVGTPESIPENCLQQAYNWEYGGEVLQPQVVQGVTIKLDLEAEATAGFYDTVHDCFLVASGQNLYQIATDFGTKTYLGTLTGTYAPVFCMYDTFCLLATGGQIQKFDGTTLSILDNSPLLHHVSTCFGRLRAYNINSDIINYSAIGDPTNWTNNPSDISSGQFIYIGYKDAGTIIATMRLSQDTIVIKSSGVPYRIVNEDNFSTVRVVAAADKVYAYNHYSSLTVGNKAYFTGKDGFQSFSTVTEYGAVKVDDPSPGYFVNPWLALNSDNNAILWHIPVKKQIWVKGQNDKFIRIYHYNVLANGVAGSWTNRDFKYQIHDVMIKDKHVYILYGNKIGELDNNSDLDDGVHFTAKLLTRRIMPTLKKFIINHFNFLSYNIKPGSAVLSIATKQYPYTFATSGTQIYGNHDFIYGNHTHLVSSQNTPIKKNLQKRVNYIDASLVVNTGRMAIHGLSINASEVNF